MVESFSPGDVIGREAGCQPESESRTGAGGKKARSCCARNAYVEEALVANGEEEQRSRDAPPAAVLGVRVTEPRQWHLSDSVELRHNDLPGVPVHSAGDRSTRNNGREPAAGYASTGAAGAMKCCE
jgi:hypothetical protein